MDVPLDMLLNSLDDVVLCVDENSTLVWLNQTAATWLGCVRDRATGQPVSRFSILNEVIPQLGLGELSAAGAPAKAMRQVETRGPGGESVTLATAVSCALIEGKRIYTAVLRDVSFQRQMEKAVYESRKTQALGALASGIAHNFNNILTAVISQIDLALHAPEFPGALKDHLIQAQTSARRGASLVNRLQAFGRQTKPDFAPVDSEDLLEQVTLLLRHSLDPSINILAPKPAAKPWLANADSNQIVQALINLCVNARDAMPQGGTLTLALENIRLNAADARPPRRVGDFVRLMVADTGPGVPTEVAARIFEPCFAGKNPGQRPGLGLAITSAVVAEHSGWMEVESQPGRGTRFSIFLPRSIDQAPASEPVAVTDSQAPEGQERILVVDDEELVRMVTKAVLAYRGYSVVEAEDGEDAVAKYAAAPGSFDLILMDMHMPRLNGSDALRRIRELNPKAKAIMFSGGVHDPEGGIGQLEKVAFLHKPFENQELLRLIRKLLDCD